MHGIVARVFSQESLEEFAANAHMPVINALSDRLSSMPGFRRFLHAGRAVRQSARAEIRLRRRWEQYVPFAAEHRRARGRARPRGHAAGLRAGPAMVAEAKRVAHETRGKIEILHSPEEAVAGVQAVYTDVWTSMGQEEESARARSGVCGYQVDAALFSRAAPDAVFMHCLPAHRGLEVTAEIIDSPRSIVYDQAENRLHVQKAISCYHCLRTRNL